MNTDKKPIPKSMLKIDLYKLYEPMSKGFIRAEINSIILGNRKSMKCFEHKTELQLKQTRFVFRNEIIEFAKIFGFPDEFINPENE